ncbi:MAG: hypothetical protein DWB56_06800 [Candidatus Jettenia sp.]|uniref:Mor transcription activator domain-containing protein n=1 Tax=Candidatus Jettenia caeni TaxID=247490 RepID=I3IMZ1_9BACT|nr:Mor transcription activator family protein [Candidatus Jettenia sp. AMX1]MBC6928662.1 hypothetical protein [Candidatus Jettenia sp.]GAB63086.1 hypothetical protein KSU1_C1490 [Candidatus Jettenia caeni]MCE7879974.1 hypothetical protein [Candidatus Jettenia sp. AMX1]MCQ3926756.1 hypothetical protein [Candidatus Jettenia sp.]MDL1938493.1 hypothetical protein [Candidatus Jettenia sp. AMX1]
MPKPMSYDALDQLYQRFCADFGPDVAEKVFKVFVQELSGCRISIPKASYFIREARNKRIKMLFHGGNYEELALRFGITTRLVRRIVHGD